MTVYRVSGEGLLQLALMAAASPTADTAAILGILRGADPEPPEMPNIADGPDMGAGDNGAVLAVKPAKPE